MIPLLPLLVDTAIAIDQDAAAMVHEWGVVVFESSGSVFCGDRDRLLSPYHPDEVCAEAPVVWIYGEPFTGEFTVHTASPGVLTFTYPTPDALSETTATWRIDAGYPEVEEEILLEQERLHEDYYGPFDWGLEYWRAVPSLTLNVAGTGTRENFLYYECSVSRDFTENFFRWNESGYPVFNGNVQDALYFTPGGVFPVTLSSDEFIPLDMPMAGETDPGFASETFCDWAGGMLKTEEITALWETWKPVLQEEGTYWLVFPIPEGYHNEISTINLSTDTGFAEYHRLFLGAVRLERN